MGAKRAWRREGIFGDGLVVVAVDDGDEDDGGVGKVEVIIGATSALRFGGVGEGGGEG